MTWLEKIPFEDGYYWIKSPNFKEPVIVKLKNLGYNKWKVWSPGIMENYREFVQKYNPTFSEKIEIPKD